jgi:hypothetical protein
MTTETKKPSEILKEQEAKCIASCEAFAREGLKEKIGFALTDENWETVKKAGAGELITELAFKANVIAYLDGEHERRAEFEADVLDRLAKLEAAAPPPEDLGPAPAVSAPPGVCSNCGCKLDVVVWTRDGHGFCGYRCADNYKPGCPRCGGAMGLQSWAVQGVGSFCSHECAESERVGDASRGAAAPAPVGVYDGDGHPALRNALEQADAVVRRAEDRIGRGIGELLFKPGRYEAEPEGSEEL